MQISVVTPTYYRHKEIPGLLKNLSSQTYLPSEVILVDGAPLQEKRTEEWVSTNKDIFPFEIRYYRKTGTPLNYDYKNRLRRKNIEPNYLENGALYINSVRGQQFSI